MRVSVRARREPLTLPHPARKVGMLKRYGVGEGESGLGADFSSFYRGVVQKCFPDANFHRFVLAGDLLVKLPGKICAGRHAGAYKSR
jgi:hypothetical protein